MEPRKRIAFLSEHASPLASLGGEDAGGQNVYVAQVSRNLAELGYDVDVFVRGDGTEPEIVTWLPHVRVVHLQVGPPRFLLKDQLWPLMPAFRDAFLDFTRATETSYDLIHSNFWMSGWVAAELKRRLDMPVVHIFHATGITKRRHQGEADTSPDGRIEIEKQIVREVDRILAQCPAEVEELMAEYGANPAKIVVTPAGVDLERFHPIPQAEARQELGLDPNAFIIVYVGRMVPRKDVRNIVRALPHLLRANCRRPIRLLVVGGESETPDPELTPEIGVLQKLAAALGVADHVLFTGARPSPELYKYYGAGDVAVTTPWYEPFGLTPLEAMACGRPVVGSRVGGIQFTVREGVTGLLVPPKNPVALATALRRFLGEEWLAPAMGKLARQRVERSFSWPSVSARIAQVYGSLLAEAHLATPERAPGTRHPTPGNIPVPGTTKVTHGAD
jgi:glycosyltransferase involved in cell wall biosynthesis